MSQYIWQLLEWPNLSWKHASLSKPLADVRHRQGRLLGLMEGLGFPARDEVLIEMVTLDVVKSSEIEGMILNLDQVRSSVARRLGIDVAGLQPADRYVDGVVRMSLDAAQNYAEPLTAERLFGWRRALFPKPAPKMKSGAWRNDASGPMQVVSGAIGRERIHCEAPPAERLDQEMTVFLDMANRTEKVDGVLLAARAHLWFVTIHPFDDGNGRIARAIADWALARSENSSRRYYSMSAQIRRERKAYYDILERTQKGSADITDWMMWFLGCLDRAIAGAEISVAAVVAKERFWRSNAHAQLNERQVLMLNKMIDGFEGKMTSSRWASLADCSQDTAQRDIADLVAKGIMVQDRAGGRSTKYLLKDHSANSTR